MQGTLSEFLKAYFSFGTLLLGAVLTGLSEFSGRESSLMVGMRLL